MTKICTWSPVYASLILLMLMTGVTLVQCENQEINPCTTLRVY